LNRSQATMGNAIHMEMPPKRERDRYIRLVLPATDVLQHCS